MKTLLVVRLNTSQGLLTFKSMPGKMMDESKAKDFDPKSELLEK